MDKYLQYSIEDFAFDDDFIKWVQSAFQYQNEKWSALKIQKEHQLNISEAILLVQSMNFEKENYSRERKEDLWTKIDEGTKETVPLQTQKSSAFKIIRFLIPLAASFLALLYFSNRNGGGPLDFQTSFAEIENIALPDGSTIDLNAKSVLKYNSAEYNDLRNINLEGEAFFNVEKGKTFKVETVHGTIEVLGTSFNIHSRPEGFEVSCITGKVKVESANKLWTVILEAGQKCYLGDDGRLKRMYGGEKDKEWMTGVHYFEKTSLEKVMLEFQRHYDVQVNLNEAIKSTEYTGSFKTKSIDDALYMICWPLKIDCEIIDDVVKMSE